MSEIKNIADIPLLKLADLRRECRLFGLSITGNKSELCQKLTQYFLEKGPPSSIEKNATFISATAQGYPHSSSMQTQSINMITSSATSHLSSSPNFKNDSTNLYAPDSYNISNNEVTSTLMAAQDKSKSSNARQIIMTDDDLLEEKLLDSSNEDSPDTIDSAQMSNQHNANTSKSQIIKLNGITNVSLSKRSALRDQKFQNTSDSNNSSAKPNHPKRMDEKMLDRAKRFGLPVKTTTSDNNHETPKSILEPDAKKLRAKRFETTVPIDTLDEKMKKSNRALRFGLK